ncbi:MAG: aminoacyl-tRNA hydrolase [Eubacteriales bacterium]|nr:aminoacyl-tRNA hydrolase [Eubacteriales bacterium]
MESSMNSFYIIAGLGNPGQKYEGTRHNIGFAVIDELADEYGIGNPSKFGKSLAAKGMIGANKVLLMKPLTYMNLSGEAVREAVDFYKADPESQLIVISDDIDLPQGQLRVRGKGSAGGHNGLKNIIQHLGTDAFCRVRVGVGAKPDPDYDLADYVLGRFRGSEQKIMEESVQRAAQAVRSLMEEGVDAAMNRYNARVK